MVSFAGREKNSSHFANIDPTQFWRSNWRYAFHLDIPKDVKSALLGVGGLPGIKQVENLGAWEEMVVIPLLQEIDTIRPFAALKTNLLEGGKHVEDRGRTDQSTTISGLSGYLAAETPSKKAPNKRQAEGLLQDRIAKKTPAKNSIVNKALRSGYGWFHKFLGIFELYGAIKKHAPPELANRVRMIWLNERDDEAWVIMPQSVRWRRSAPKQNFTYAWSLTFEILYAYNDNTTLFSDPSGLDNIDYISEMSSAAKVLVEQKTTYDIVSKDVNGALRRKLEPLTKINVAVSNLIANLRGGYQFTQGAISTLTDFALDYIKVGEDVLRFVNDELLLNDNTILRALEGAFISSSQAINRIASAAMNLHVPTLEDLKFWENERTKGYVPTTYGAATPNDIANTRSFDTRPESTPPATRLNRSRYGSNAIQTRNAHTTLTPQDNTITYNATRDDTIRVGETIMDVAQRTLGDARLWYLIAMANKLTTPYIVNHNADNPNGGKVLRTGDPIRIPTVSVGGFSNYIENVNEPYHGRLPQTSGLASNSSTNRKLVDGLRPVGASPWYKNQWKGFTCSILGGTNEGTRAVVRKSSVDTLYFYLDATLRKTLRPGDLTMEIISDDLSDFPDSGQIILEPGTGNEEVIAYTSRDGNVLTLAQTVSAVHGKNYPLIQTDYTFPSAFDDTSEYLVFMDLELSPVSHNTPDAAFGYDFRIVRKSDGSTDIAVGADGDIAVVTGVEAYVQSLRIGLSTPIGGNPLMREDGLTPFIGRKATADNIALYMMNVRRVILADPRTNDILYEGIKVDSANRILSIRIDVETVGGAKGSVVLGNTSSSDFKTIP